MKKSKRRKVRVFVLSCVAVLVVLVSIYLHRRLCIITGYAAKNLCSAVFVSGRDAQSVEALDLNFSLIKFARNTVNYTDSTVTSRFLWGKTTAVYRKGFGVTVLRGNQQSTFRRQRYPLSQPPAFCSDSVDWPLGDRLPLQIADSVNITLFDSIAHEVVDKQSYGGTPFAFLVVRQGRLVAERYKAGFDRHTRLLSWSMAKSLTNAMVGLAVDAGLVDLNAPMQVDEWQHDGRAAITLNNLLQMQGGFRWNENYGSRSDVNQMLFCTADMGLFALRHPLKYKPGTHWTYSTGTTNIVCRYLKKLFTSDSAYYALISNGLFRQIGMQSAIFEVDMTGTLIGSSYVYATARDYARFGLLYLNDGMFNGKRVLPEGWVRYTTTPAAASEGKYGAFFWLNSSGRFPDAPRNLFWCDGFNGQYIFVLPSQQMVVVLLGHSPAPFHTIDRNRLLREIVAVSN